MSAVRHRPCLIIGLALYFGCCVTAETVDFNRDIRPLLSDRCFVCHGPDEAARQADLRLDEEASAKEYAIVPGDADSSELVQRIRSDDPDLRMPPPDSKLSLSASEIALLRDWIEQGAPWQKHWSYVAVDEVRVPQRDAPSHPIDAFVHRQLESHQLKPRVEADRATLIRRLSFALTGLPPTLAEIDAFVSDDSGDAYERLIDRLLRSARYGERMATDWLDVARYSDTYGYQVDRDRYVWPYRDWVVRAFNQNMPYDQFVIEQLAGDLLPGATEDQILATTFNRLHPQECEGGSIPEEFRIKSVSDRTETFATAFMGLTMECCRCHDHKFDPLSQKEYYQVSAFFDNIDEAGLYPYFTQSIPTPSLLLPTGEQRRRRAQLRSAIDKAESELVASRESRRNAFSRWLERASPASGQSILKPVLHLDFEQPPAKPNRHVAGKVGHAVELTGDDGVVTEVGNFKRYQPFSLALWMQTPDHKRRAVICHRSRAWTDAGSRGYELLIKDGCLQFALIHFWPGNAIAIKTREPVPLSQWVHVAVTYDGSSRADGLRIWMNGQAVATQIVRDNLVKKITGGGGDTITIGERFRDKGFTEGQVDEFYVFDHALTGLAIQQLVGHIDVADVLKTAGEPRSSEQTEELFEYYLMTQDETFREQRERLAGLRKELTELTDTMAEIMVMRETPSPRTSYLLLRGNYDSHGEQVEPSTPESLGALGDDLPANRLGLARWLTHPDHPLTARVQVNRVWQMLFGQGLVRTPEDFGRQGERPTHPELLDWLARDFVEHGWDTKRLIKQIVMSTTYRQSSNAVPDLIARDPDNRFLARGPSYRLPAEMMRDNALAAGELLIERFGGPPVKPYDVEEAFSPVERDHGEGLYRRSLYTYWKRTGPAPVMTTFDAARRDVCRMRRERTSTPLQALVLLNGPQFVEACRALGQRVLEQHGDDHRAAMHDLFRRLTARAPSEQGLDVLMQLFAKERNHFQQHPEDTEAFLSVGDFHVSESLDRATLAAVATVANALLSYDEVQMLR